MSLLKCRNLTNKIDVSLLRNFFFLVLAFTNLYTVNASEKCSEIYEELVRQNEVESDSAFATAVNLQNCISTDKSTESTLDNYRFHIGRAYKNNYRLDTAMVIFQNLLKKESVSESLTLKVYNEVIDILYQKSQIVERNKYSKLQLELALKIRDTTQIIEAYDNLGFDYKYNNQKDSAAYAYNKAMDLSLIHGDTLKYNRVKFSYANLTVEKGEPYTALKYLKEIEKYSKSKNAKKLLADVYFSFASVYRRVGRYEDAVKYYKLVIPMYLEDKSFDRLPKLYANLGILYEAMRNNEDAMNSYLKAIEYTQEYDDNLRCGLNSIIGNLYLEMGEFENGITYLRDGLKICNEINREIRIAEGNLSISKYYTLRSGDFKNLDYDSAIYFAERSLELYRTLERSLGQVASLQRLSELYYLKGDVKSSEKYILQGWNLAQESDIPSAKINILSELSNFYSKTGDYKKAYNFNVEYQELLDLEHKLELNNKINQNLSYFEYLLTVKQDSLKNDHRIALQKVQIADKDKLLNIQGLAIVFISVILVVLIVLLYTLFKRNRELNAAREEIEVQRNKAEERGDELSKAIEKLKRTQNELVKKEKLAVIGSLTQNMAHELKNPLNFISGAARVLKMNKLEIQNSDVVESEKLFDLIDDGVNRMLKIIDGLHKMAPSEFKMEKLDLKCLIEDELSRLVKKYTFDISIKSSLNESYFIYSDLDSLKIILANILNNAAEAIEPSGEIEVSISESDSTYNLLIKDNGKGMSEDTLSKALEPFSTTKSELSGVGIGLFKAYTILKKLGGNLKIISELGIGTKVSITIKKRTIIN